MFCFYIDKDIELLLKEAIFMKKIIFKIIIRGFFVLLMLLILVSSSPYTVDHCFKQTESVTIRKDN